MRATAWRVAQLKSRGAKKVTRSGNSRRATARPVSVVVEMTTSQPGRLLEQLGDQRAKGENLADADGVEPDARAAY